MHLPLLVYDYLAAHCAIANRVPSHTDKISGSTRCDSTELVASDER